MIDTCYRRMILFNEALKVYENIQSLNSDNIDSLRGLSSNKKRGRYALFITQWKTNWIR